MKTLLLVGIVFSTLHISNSVLQEFCNAPPDGGQGKLFLFSVFYDPTSDQCKPFFYQGEGGNNNRFLNERECMRNCSERAENLYPMQAVKACHYKHEKGGCSGHYLRYYYDSVHNKCKKFIWTGCLGNGNRFFSHESCNATCAGIHDDGEELEEDEPDTPIAIICGVLLSVIILSIIITVTVLTVQSKKKKAMKTREKSTNPQSDAPLQEGGIEMT
ncbi:kunitz-type serine protease inhibitor bitisilin-3 isoform 1-T1 [Menidia menidia]